MRQLAAQLKAVVLLFSYWVNSVLIQLKNSVDVAVYMNSEQIWFSYKSSSTEDNSVIVQRNSVQVLFSPDSVSAVKSMILLNIKCLLTLTNQANRQETQTPSGDRNGWKKALEKPGTMNEHIVMWIRITSQQH